MTLEEAMRVAAVCSEADGGCPDCVQKLADILQLAFVEFNWAIDESGKIGVSPSAPQENQLTDWELQKRKPQ